MAGMRTNVAGVEVIGLLKFATPLQPVLSHHSPNRRRTPHQATSLSLVRP